MNGCFDIEDEDLRALIFCIGFIVDPLKAVVSVSKWLLFWGRDLDNGMNL